MSRACYTDDLDWQASGRWRAAVSRAICGKRGQAFLRETLASLDALPVPELAAASFAEGSSPCTLGAVGLRRGISLARFEPHALDEGHEVDTQGVADTFGIADAMAREIMYLNDEVAGERWGYTTIYGRPVLGPHEDPARARWRYMRAWVVGEIRGAAA